MSNGPQAPELRRTLRLGRPVPPLHEALNRFPTLLAELPGLTADDAQPGAIRLRVDDRALHLAPVDDDRWELSAEDAATGLGERLASIEVQVRDARLRFVATGFQDEADRAAAERGIAALYQVACNLEAALVDTEAAPVETDAAPGTEPADDRAPGSGPAGTLERVEPDLTADEATGTPDARRRAVIVTAAMAVVALAGAVAIAVRRRSSGRPRPRS